MKWCYPWIERIKCEKNKDTFFLVKFSTAARLTLKWAKTRIKMSCKLFSFAEILKVFFSLFLSFVFINEYQIKFYILKQWSNWLLLNLSAKHVKEFCFNWIAMFYNLSSTLFSSKYFCGIYLCLMPDSDLKYSLYAIILVVNNVTIIKLG